MFDDKPVHLAMERIFTPLAATDVVPPAPGRSRSIEAPARRRRWFLGKDGIAAAGFALAITGVGLVAVPLLTAPRTPSAPAIVAPARSVLPAAPAIPAPTPVIAPPAATVSPAPPPVAVAPAPAAAPMRVTQTRRFAGSTRRARSYRARHYRVRRGSPRLAGAALRRALARDVILTRRLNQEALRRLRAR